MRGGRFYEVVRVQKTLGLLLKKLTLLPKLVVYRAILKLRPIVGVKWRKKKKKGKKREYFQIPCFISFDSSMRLGIK